LHQQAAGAGLFIEKLKLEISNKLEQLTDPETDERVIFRVYRREEVFSGPYVEDAPDLFVGFNVGYRAPWQTAIGGAGTKGVVIEDNTRRWSGDHCFDPSLVPGVFLSNHIINTDKPHIMDIAPTVLKLLNAEIPDEMEGKPLM
jgi:predicted AlkP superfamily phosphohydrolase/phosphomutase